MTTQRVTVTLFGRVTEISDERLDVTASTIALLTCHAKATETDVKAINRVNALIRRVTLDEAGR